ncbi:MAG TPA: hypothetical protein PLN52_09710, partial [Opitutaceae bacterium]|nr:hypothetical protein [Opitutaceae bacterium]
SATNRGGTAVNIYQAETLSMTAAGLVYNQREHEATTVGLNVERPLDLAVPVTLKTGFLIDRQDRYIANDTQSLAFNPPSGATGRMLSNYDALSTG